MGAIEDLKYYEKKGMGLVSLGLTERAVLELDEKLEITIGLLNDHEFRLDEAVKVVKDYLNSKAGTDQEVHGGTADDNPTI